MKTKKEEIASAIIRTIIYSDIFDYPLTLSEITKFLISKHKISTEDLKKVLLELVADQKFICVNGEFYFLKGRQEIVKTRLNRRKNSEKKLIIAEKVASKLSFFPWVKMIAITGALAMENCDIDDDIDFLIITTAERLWLTRLLIYLLVTILGIKRRKPKEKEVGDKICLNLFLEEDSLKIQPENLFFAHEICQTRPIFVRGDTYEKFLWENRWVRKFLPYGVKISAKCKVQSAKLKQRGFLSQYLNILISFLERIAFALQYQYMKPKITNEKISRHQAFFHPQNLQKKICVSFEEKTKRIKMLDKVGEWLI